MYAYAHAPLDEDTIEHTSFSSGAKLFAFIRILYGLKGLPNFFTKQISTFVPTKQNTCSNSSNNYTLSVQKNNLKLAPEKSFFKLLKSNFLDIKLVTIQLNKFVRKLQLFIKSLLQLAKLH